jgi:peptidoglycan LD-endopeptidase CwlK
MTDPFVGLDSTFESKLRVLLADLQTAGIIMRPYFGVRDCVTQAKLWRQSRSMPTISAKIAELRAAGAHYLADAIVKAGPVSGQWATNAIPGYSWHQHGSAMDCVWMRNGVEEWGVDIDGPKNGYRVYATAAPGYGLTSLANIGDWGHVQLHAAGSPAGQYTLQEIDTLMRTKFG